ncbi:MAG: hypothetical protein GF311_00275, partial [Candidatus Lokiarchaeota archaeon]|nr:hypothetical protein [Candidatus Lokiarchaeota archaeon]
MKNVILGIDGGNFDFIIDQILKNKLPNFKRFIKKGCYSKLISTVPPVTIPSWPCLFSGLNPEELDYYWFDHPQIGIFNSHIWREKSIFSIEDFKQFVLNVPGTYPTWKINGEMISGMLSPKLNCYPVELKYFIKENWIINGKNIKDIFKAFEIKKKLFLKKLEEDFNLLTYVIRLPDSLSHRYGIEPRKLKKLFNLGYELIDNFIGEILKHDIDNLIIFSDHGLKYYSYKLNIKRWLEKHGIRNINGNFNSKIRTLFDNYIKLTIELFRKAPFLKRIITSLKSGKAKEKSKLAFKNKEINKTKVLSLVGNYGCIFLRGKDRKNKLLIKEKLENYKHIQKIYTYEKRFFPDFIVQLKRKFSFSIQD